MALYDTVTQPKKASELDKLDHLHRRATIRLFSCSALFPFDLFPDSLVIDHNKVDIVYRNFFGHNHTVSLPIERLNYVGVNSVLFLSTLRFETKGLEQNPEPLTMLPTHAAQYAKNLIFGLMAAEKNGIDLSHLSRDDILDKLVEIGRVE
jgi:hypothetical protein